MDEQIGLTNLYNICSKNKESDWTQLINQHFTQMKKIKEEENEILPKLEKLETASQYIKYRVYSIDYLKFLNENTIFDKSNIDFIGVVVIDLPGSVKNLQSSYIKKWSISKEEIIKLAIANTLKESSEQFEKYTINETFSIYTLLSANNIFITSCIYDLKSKNIPLETFGAFIAIPNRLGILTLPVAKKSISTDLFQLMSLANYMYAQGPGSITNTIFWFDGNMLYKVEHNLEKNSIQLPQKLVELIK